MNNEFYLNHPTFGLLYRVCLLGENQEIFTTLYAQRLFFLVNIKPEGISFESISRADARIMIENRLRQLRRTGSTKDYQELYQIYQKIWV